MCYGNPHELVRTLLIDATSQVNGLGHTALDDFQHFCSYAGLDLARVGEDAFAWAMAGYLSAWQPSAQRHSSDDDATKTASRGRPRGAV